MSTQEPWFVILVVAAILFLLLATMTRTWIRESRRPFRYTYAISAFRRVEASPAAEQLSWLQHDLTERLSERIARLSQSPEGREATQGYDSFIHIGGQYIVRRDGDDPWTIEILPWVSIGPGATESLGHPVKYELPRDDDLSPAAGGADPDDLSLDLSRGVYDSIFERVYFSVATQIYRKIREDVEKKIALLPPWRLRAAAYYYEAEDYARSNTLDACDGARDLFRRALELYDPAFREPASSVAGRTLRRLAVWRADAGLAVRGALARVWPRFGRRAVLISRATIGLANMQVYRRMLAGLSGARLNPVFEARPLLGEALIRLRRLPDDVPGRSDALFDAHVTRAVVLAQLGAMAGPGHDLDAARAVMPGRASLDAPYLFARGLLEAQPRTAISLMRQAVEVDPYFEVAQSELAHMTELIWRGRPHFEPEVAEVVFDEYRRVLHLNPGNLAAWANLGYMHWLLDDAASAARAFRRGRDYKLIKSDTFVAELDYGMARLAAEAGDWIEAYRHYLLAVPAFLTQGKAFLLTGTGAQAYYFDLIGRAMLDRFDLYVKRVEKRAGQSSSAGDTIARVRDSVRAFVLNDYGEACRYYYLRTGHAWWKDEARAQFTRAAQLNPRYVMPIYNLYLLDWDAATSLDLASGDAEESADRQVARVEALDQAIEHLDRVTRLEPEWIEAQLDRIVVTSHWLPRASAAVAALRKAASKERAHEESLREERAVLRKRSRASQAPTGKLEGDEQRRRKEQVESRLRAELCSTRADEYEGLVAARKKEVLELLPKLLPHAWLGLARDLGESDVGIDRVLKMARRRAHTWRWQREFDDVHAEAMLTWARSLAAKTPKLAGRLATQYAECFRSEEDFPMVQLRRELSRPNGGDKHLGALLAAHVDQWLKRDPAAYWALRWLPEATELDGWSTHLVGAVEQPGAEASLCTWAGHQLEELLLAAAEEDRGRWSEVGRVYERALNDGRQAGHPADVDNVVREARIGRARVMWSLRPLDERPAEALRALDEIEASPGQDAQGWRRELMETFCSRGQLGGAHDLPTLGGWLDSQHARASRAGNKSALRDIARARLVLLDSRNSELRRASRRSSYADAAPGERVLWVRPIVVRASPTLIPSEEDLTDDHELLTNLIPAMRRRVLQDFGLGLPGVRLKSDPFLPADSYRISFNETVIADGRVSHGRRFLDRAAAVDWQLPPSAAEDDVLDGWWVPPAELRPEVDAATWSPLEYVMRHLERLVRGHIATFAGVVEVQRAVERWEVRVRPNEAASRGRWVAEVLPDLETLVRLTQIVRDLLREGMPIADVGQVLAAFERMQSDRAQGHIAQVEQMRLLLSGWLPGNSDARTMVSLPSWLERHVAAAIAGAGEHRVLLLPDREAEDLVDEVRHRLGGVPPRRAALLVSRADIRPFMRRLLEPELPELAVVARRELLGSIDEPPDSDAELLSARRSA